MAVAALALAGPNASADVARVPRILVLASDPHTAPGLVELELSIRRTVADAFGDHVEIEFEHLDFVYNVSPEYRKAVVDLLRSKRAGHTSDVVITVGAGALRFAMDEKASLFPDAPIVFGWITSEDLAALGPNKPATGVVTEWGFGKELETALRILPRTRRAVIILGNGLFEKRYEPAFRREIEPLRNRVELDWWVGAPMAELESRIAQLPPHTVVIYIAIYRDAAGNNFIPMLAFERLARRSNAPLFAVLSHWVGRGAVGDGRIDISSIGTQVGEMTVRILRGESPSSIGIIENGPATPTFDARQLDKWDIPRRLLPAGSRVIFEEPSIWAEYRTVVILGILVIIAQSGLLAAFVVQRLARRRAERAESESQYLHKSVLDSLESRVATIANDGTIVAVNRAWEEFARMRESSAPLGVGSNYLDFVKRALDRGQDDARRTLDALTAVLSGRAASQLVGYSSPGPGERGRYEMKIIALHHSGGGAIVMIQDITDRWQAEERVRITLESLPLATFLTDTVGRIELLNAEAMRLVGYERDELLDRSITALVPAISNERLSRTPKDGEYLSLLGRGIPCRRKDGTELPVQAHIRPIVMSSRGMVLVTLYDLTDRQQLDAEMQRLRDETAHFGRVAAIGELSGAIAHELNQPLTGILTNSQAAQRFLEEGNYSPEDMNETLSDIIADTRRAGDVIQRLRTMLRKGQVESRPVDVNDLVKQVVRLVGHDLSLRGSVLDLELTENLPSVAGDRIHLQQVVLNLILNGADAMAELPPARRRLLLRTAPGIEHTVKLEIRDSGPGISPLAMSHIFEPFFTTKSNGMGIGLSIVRSIVETHGGRITCGNAASGGAIFTVVLPAQQDGEAA